MDDFLNDIYKRSDIGLKSRDKFYQYLQKNYKDKGITYDDVDNFLSKQKSEQLYKVVKNDGLYNKTISYGIGDCLQIDTMDLNPYKSQNKNYRYILVCIDVYSRRVFLRALLDKSADQVVKVCYDIKKDEFEKNGYKINSIITDLGKEYDNTKFKNLFDGVKLFRKNDETFNSALAVVDRVMKTIRGYFKKLFVLNNNFVWINDLFNIQNNYNSTYHSTIKATPDDVFYGKVKPYIDHENNTDKLELGQQVRIKIFNKKNIFDKKSNTIWSNEIYIIRKI